MTIMLNGSDLTVTQVVAVARHGEAVALAPAAIAAMGQARTVVQEVLRTGEPVYGLTTGVGERKAYVLEQAERQRFNQRLVLNHRHALEAVDQPGQGDRGREPDEQVHMVRLGVERHGRNPRAFKPGRTSKPQIACPHAGAKPGVKITAIRLDRMRLPFDPPFYAAWDPVPRRHFDATLVRAQTDEGITGYGSGDTMDGFEPRSTPKAIWLSPTPPASAPASTTPP
jgi:Aromatic amino acid lyase